MKEKENNIVKNFKRNKRSKERAKNIKEKDKQITIGSSRNFQALIKCIRSMIKVLMNITKDKMIV